MRQNAVPIAEPLLPETTGFEVEMSLEKLKRHKSQDIEQILAGFIQVETATIHSAIHKVISSVWSKEELPEQ
jgi:hypothetical protein